MAGVCRNSSRASPREVRVKVCCLSLWKRMLYTLRAGVAPTTRNKGCVTLKEQIPELNLKGKRCIKPTFGSPSTKIDANLLEYSPSCMEFRDMV